jgi:SAM-dependent methyltransferase
MISEAMIPFGRALGDYAEGKQDAQLLVRRDDGYSVPLPISAFFREPEQLSSIETEALHRCGDSVLDIGAGSGLHSLVLQARGVNVTATDINRDAVEVMIRRGVRDAQWSDIFDYRGGPFDTLLMLGHGIGMVGTLKGLDRFLVHAHTLVRSNGQLLIHSMDIRRTKDPTHLSYHEANRRGGHYVGETRIQFEYNGKQGPFCEWLHVDFETLKNHAAGTGWDCSVVLEDTSGEYLALLRKDSR